MKIRALIPSQRFSDAKSRLQHLLSPQERASLAQEMLEHVLSTIALLDADVHPVVLTNDAQVQSVARRMNALTQPDNPTLQGHGAQLAHAIHQVPGDEAVLVLMTDLPLLQKEDIQEMLRAGELCRAVLAPDRRNLGTNAALFPTPKMRRPHFGNWDSFVRHVNDFQSVGVEPAIVERLGFSHDLDDEDDLSAILAQSPPTASLSRSLRGFHAKR